MSKRFNLSNIPEEFMEKEPKKYRKISVEKKISTNPYILENKIIKKLNSFIDSNYKEKSFDSLSKEEIKNALRNKVMDFTHNELEKYHDLPENKLYTTLINNLSKKYYDE